jgi:signal transduction histidine kinase
LRRFSLRTRLTWFCAIVVLLAVAGFGFDVWWLQGRLGLRRVDRDLQRLTTTAAGVIANELAEDPTDPVGAADEASRTIASAGQSATVFDLEGRRLAPATEGVDWGLPRSADDGPVVWTRSTAAGRWRVRAERREVGGNPFVLVVASSLRDVEVQQHEVVEAMWIALPVMVLLAGAAGLWLATAGLRPLTDLAHQAASITATGSETLAPGHSADELGQFASAFNTLLARLRQSLQTQQQFMADASHELRTPVSVVRAAADVALQQPTRTEAEYREALDAIREQARRVTKLVDSMLVLARADAGGYPVRHVDLYIDELVADCCRALQPVAAQRAVHIHMVHSNEIPFRGDEDLLRQLVLNVLLNAVQYTPAGGHVEARVAADAGCVTIAVRDEGPGIATADRARIFDRFVRLDAARSAGGAGLGLPIAAWIAQVHGGTIELGASGPSGSEFVIALPLGGDSRPA